MWLIVQTFANSQSFVLTTINYHLPVRRIRGGYSRYRATLCLEWSNFLEPQILDVLLFLRVAALWMRVYLFSQIPNIYNPVFGAGIAFILIFTLLDDIYVVMVRLFYGDITYLLEVLTAYLILLYEWASVGQLVVQSVPSS